MYKRKQIFSGSEGESLFFWGARQTGKSTLLKSVFQDVLYIDLLKTDLSFRFEKTPSLLREIVLANLGKLVIIDEIQKVPLLLDEVHWLIEQEGVRFILSGSSSRKILRSGVNLLGGRALRYELYPLVSAEIPDFNLLRALNHGLLPRHYISENPKKLLEAYVVNYLRDEIVMEAKIRNSGAFYRFLEAAAFTNGEIVNFTNIATDCGVSSVTAKEYFQILDDTLIGRFLPSFQKKQKRRVVAAPKFYFFDIGIVNHLLKRGKIEAGTPNYGNALEHLIYMELYAYSKYSELDFPISYWRTTSQNEIDFVLGDAKVAIEVKSTTQVQSKHLQSLKLFQSEFSDCQGIVISNEPFERRVGGITIMPVEVFLSKLWNGEILND